MIIEKYEKRLGREEYLSPNAKTLIELAGTEHEALLLPLADLGVSLIEIAEVLLPARSDMGDVLEILPDFLYYITYGRKLGRALKINKDLIKSNPKEILSNPCYEKLIWLNSEPERLLDLLERGADHTFVQEHIFNGALCTYLEYEIDSDLYGERYKLFYYISKHYNYPGVVMDMAYRVHKRGNTTEKTYSIITNNNDYERVYGEFMEELYQGDIGNTRYNKLVLLEALYDRGYKLYEANEIVSGLKDSDGPASKQAVLAILNSPNIETYLSMGITVEALADLASGELPDYFLGGAILC